MPSCSSNKHVAHYLALPARPSAGDTGGLQLIPGLTQSGKQRTPDWLADLLGVEHQEEAPAGAVTMESLFGPQP